MPYLGNTPSTSFATVVKDTFNGGSTAYTLSKVATTNSVSVFVENVRQEPTTAYSVSGTTLTFTATTPSGTGNIYVLHMNPTTTTTHPAAQNLTAVNGTLTGTLDVTGDVAIDSDTLFVDVSQDNVGINTNAVDSDVALEVNGNVAFKNGSNYSLYADVDGALTAYHNGTAAIATASGGAVTVTNGITLSDGDLTVANGHGISFAATTPDGTSVGSELLDDYEEGTFTPSISVGSGSVTLKSGYDLMSYTKIGNLVNIRGRIETDSVSSPSGTATLTGLPFTSSNSLSERSGRSGGQVLHDTFSGLGGGSVSYQMSENTTTLVLYEQFANGVGSLGDNFQTNSLIVFDFSYPAA